MKKRTFLSVVALLAGLNCMMTVISKDTFPHWIQITLTCLHVLIAIALLTVVVLQLRAMRNENIKMK